MEAVKNNNQTNKSLKVLTLGAAGTGKSAIGNTLLDGIHNSGRFKS